jgi:hypothetical protein
MKGPDHGSDIPVFENQASRLACSTDDNIHHGASQIVRLNHLTGEQQAKHGVDCAQRRFGAAVRAAGQHFERADLFAGQAPYLFDHAIASPANVSRAGYHTRNRFNCPPAAGLAGDEGISPFFVSMAPAAWQTPPPCAFASSHE